jgi:hypothetical protein
LGTTMLAGATVREDNVAAVMVAVVLPVMVPATESCAAAVMVELPVARAIAMPLVTLATLLVDELQPTEAVRSFVEPSE